METSSFFKMSTVIFKIIRWTNHIQKFVNFISQKYKYNLRVQ